MFKPRNSDYKSRFLNFGTKFQKIAIKKKEEAICPKFEKPYVKKNC